MKKYLYILILVFVSCKKDKSEDEPIPTPDVIVSVDYNPDIVVNSITSTWTHPSGCGIIDLPGDTTVTDSISVESSNGFEYKITATNFYQSVSVSNPCENYNYSVQISALDSGDSVAVTPNSPCVQLFSAGEKIGANLSYGSSGNIVGRIYLVPGCSVLNESYLGIKRKSGNSTSYGWIKFETLGNNGVIIKECAINKASGNSITAGQVQ